MKLLDFYFHDGKGVLEIEMDGIKYRFMNLDITPPKAAGCEQRFEEDPGGDAWTFSLVAANGDVPYRFNIPYHRGERQ